MDCRGASMVVVDVGDPISITRLIARLVYRITRPAFVIYGPTVSSSGAIYFRGTGRHIGACANA